MRRLLFVVLGVLTLVVLGEISKLNLQQYLKPTKVSEISSSTHNVCKRKFLEMFLGTQVDDTRTYLKIA